MADGFTLPPADERPDGLEVLAFHRGKWRHVRWVKEHSSFITGYGGPFIAEGSRAFAPIPPKPADAEDFFSYR